MRIIIGMTKVMGFWDNNCLRDGENHSIADGSNLNGSFIISRGCLRKVTMFLALYLHFYESYTNFLFCLDIFDHISTQSIHRIIKIAFNKHPKVEKVFFFLAVESEYLQPETS